MTERGTLSLHLKDGAEYHWEGCSNVRLATRELRWTNARGEKRSMALAFLQSWNFTPALPLDTNGSEPSRTK